MRERKRKRKTFKFITLPRKGRDRGKGTPTFKCLASSCAVAVILRNHFLWSVFSPKLLYELVFSVTMLAAHAVSLLAAAAADLASLSVIQ